MAVRTTFNVSLTPELQQFVHDRVASGQYQSASDVVREGLRLMESQEQERLKDFQALKAGLEEASAAASRGELIDPRETLKKIQSLKRERKAARKA